MRRWLWPATAAALAWAAYLNALHNPFVYDDHVTVVANRSLVDLSNVRFLFLYSPFRPIVNLSYALDRGLWGYRPFGFHLTNVALHAAVVVLLFMSVRRMLEDAASDSVRREGGREPRGGGRHLRPSAFLAAAVFAAHPMQTEAVAYVSGRSELMCAFWFLAAVLLARDAMAFGGGVRAAAACVCGALAIASKEVGLVLPAIVLAYDWLLRPGDEQRRWLRLWRIFVPGFVLVLLVAGIRLFTLGAAASGAAAPFLNLMTQSIVIWRYAALIVWPHGQSIMHGVHRVISFADPRALVASAALVVLGILLIAARRTAPVVTFGLLWFLIVLAPSSSVVPLAEGMAEHRVYLASAGIFIAMSSIVAAWLSAPRRAKRPIPVPYFAAAAVLLTVLCALTVMRNRVWADPVSLWTEASVHAAGMWEPHYALADALRERGNCGAAVPEYRTVVHLSPRHRDGYVNLGICLAQTGQLDEAERAFRQALEIDPRFARGYTNLGTLALLEGDAERARDFYREAIAQDADNVFARMQLASLYENTFHDYHAAARMCGEARLIAPSTPGVAECVQRNQQLAAAKDQGR